MSKAMASVSRFRLVKASSAASASSIAASISSLNRRSSSVSVRVGALNGLRTGGQTPPVKATGAGTNTVLSLLVLSACVLVELELLELLSDDGLELLELLCDDELDKLETLCVLADDKLETLDCVLADDKLETLD